MTLIDRMISVVTGLLGAMFDMLPTSNITVLDPSAWGSTLGEVGAWLGGWQTVVPIKSILTITSGILVVTIPAVLAYRVANWFYKHIPQVFGTGPGAG